MLKNYTIAGVFLAIFAFCMPFLMMKNYFYSANATRFFGVVIITLILAGIYAYRWYRTEGGLSVKRRWLLLGLLGTFALMIILSLIGVNTAQSWWSDILRQTGLIFIAHIGLLIFFASELLKKADWGLVQRGLAIGSAVFSFFYFFGNEGFEVPGRFLTMNFEVYGLSFGNPTFAAGFVVFGIVFSLIALGQARKWSRVWFAWILAILVQVFSPLLFNFTIFSGETALSEVVSNPALILGSTRASSAVVFAMFVYLAGRWIIRHIFAKRDMLKRRLSVAYAIVFGLAIFAGIVMLFIPGSRVQNAYIEQSTAARVIVWESGLQAIADRPLFGWGPENFDQGFQRNFDNRLYLDENIGEVWFDRAHNIFIDTLVNIGFIGFLAMLGILIGTMIILQRAYRRGELSSLETHLLSLALLANLVQMQTAFESGATYFAGALIVGYAVWLEKNNPERPTEHVFVGKAVQQTVAGVIALMMIASIVFFVIRPYVQGKAVTQIFRATDPERTLVLVDRALSRPGSFEMGRLLSSSLIKGSVEKSNAVFNNQALFTSMKAQLARYNEHFTEYVEKHPRDYRARMNLAYILFFETVTGTDELDRAREIIESSYVLSPENPLTYIMHASAFLYEGDFDSADAKLAEARALNPDIDFVEGVQAFMDRQREKFPTISFLKLENI